YSTPPPATHTLSLHDALPISHPRDRRARTHLSVWRQQGTGGGDGTDFPLGLSGAGGDCPGVQLLWAAHGPFRGPRFPAQVAKERSEEHTSELQSLTNLVCRLL